MNWLSNCVRIHRIFQIWRYDYLLFPDLKRVLAGKKFSSNEVGIAETEDNFEAKGKSYYKNGIEKLYGYYNHWITLEGNNVK